MVQVDDVIRIYKNDAHSSNLMREDANANMVGADDVTSSQLLCSLKPCSACLRTCKITMTALPQVAGKRNLSKSVNSTESALASKIRKTQETKARLEKTILDVDLEIQNLTRTSAKLTKLLGRRKASLQTAEKRMQVLEHPHISTWTCSC